MLVVQTLVWGRGTYLWDQLRHPWDTSGKRTLRLCGHFKVPTIGYRIHPFIRTLWGFQKVAAHFILLTTRYLCTFYRVWHHFLEPDKISRNTFAPLDSWSMPLGSWHTTWKGHSFQKDCDKYSDQNNMNSDGGNQASDGGSYIVKCIEHKIIKLWQQELTVLTEHRALTVNRTLRMHYVQCSDDYRKVSSQLCTNDQ